MNGPFAPHLILTTYFTGKPDPQRWDVQHEPDQFEKMQKWYESVVQLGMHAVVEHDGLSEEFVQKYTCENVRFVPYALQTERSLNDERFYCYRDFFTAHPEIEFAFMTDLFDVDFLRNPFDLIDDEKYDYYCGDQGGQRIGSKKPTMRRMKRAYGKLYHLNKPEMNAGLIGGSRENLLRLVSRMVLHFDKSRNRKNTNMGVFNRCIHDVCPDPSRILHGSPLHSKFRGFEEDDGVFHVRHK